MHVLTVCPTEFKAGKPEGYCEKHLWLDNSQLSEVRKYVIMGLRTIAAAHDLKHEWKT